MDKLIHADYYDHIEENLGCSNVGGRKQRNIRDHLFVLYSVINDVEKGEKDEELEVQGIDIIKCFDEMGFKETHIDLWDHLH